MDPSAPQGSSGTDAHTEIPWDRSSTGRCVGAGPAASVPSRPGGAAQGVCLSPNSPGAPPCLREGQAAAVDARGPRGSGGHPSGRCRGRPSGRQTRKPRPTLGGARAQATYVALSWPGTAHLASTGLPGSLPAPLPRRQDPKAESAPPQGLRPSASVTRSVASFREFAREPCSPARRPTAPLGRVLIFSPS